MIKHFRTKLSIGGLALSAVLTGCSSGPDKLVINEVPDKYKNDNFVSVQMSKETLEAIHSLQKKYSHIARIRADRNMDEFNKQLNTDLTLTDDDKKRYTDYFKARPSHLEEFLKQSIVTKQNQIKQLKEEKSSYDKKVARLKNKLPEIKKSKDEYHLIPRDVFKPWIEKAKQLMISQEVSPVDMIPRPGQTRLQYQAYDTQDKEACQYTSKDFRMSGYYTGLEYRGAPVWMNDKCYRLYDADLLMIVLRSFYQKDPKSFESSGQKEKILADFLPLYKDYISKNLKEIEAYKELRDTYKLIDESGYKDTRYLEDIDKLKTDIGRIKESLANKDENARNASQYYRSLYQQFLDEDNAYLSQRIAIRHRANLIKMMMDKFKSDLDIVTEHVGSPIGISGSDYSDIYLVPGKFKGIEPFTYIKSLSVSYASDSMKKLDEIKVPFQSSYEKVRANLSGAVNDKRITTIAPSFADLVIWHQFFNDKDEANAYRFFTGVLGSDDKRSNQKSNDKIKQALIANKKFDI